MKTLDAQIVSHQEKYNSLRQEAVPSNEKVTGNVILYCTQMECDSLRIHISAVTDFHIRSGNSAPPQCTASSVLP